MTQYGFHFDNSRCTGCRTCQLACMDYKDCSLETSFRKVYDYEGGTWEVADDGTATCNVYSYHVSLGCQHCDHPSCVDVCPTKAMHKDPETGLVNVDASKCIGCGYCVMACPYNVPTVDYEAKHSVKCDGCADRVAAGLHPICVESCPLRALDFGDVRKLKEKYPNTIRGIAPMPDPSITSPNIYITTSDDARVTSEADGLVSNSKEVK